MLLYIDPGSGSLIIQAIIAGFATLALSFTFIRNQIVLFFKSIISFFKKKKND